jgi:hypothetical protein
MNERDDGVNNTALPTERAQPWQPIQRGSDQEPVEHSRPLQGVLIEAGKMRRQKDEAGTQAPVLDHARFTAGIIGLYEAVLSEPVPQTMLRLIEEIGKQERKY